MCIDENNNKSNILNQLEVDVSSIVAAITSNYAELSAYLYGSILEESWQLSSDIDMLFLCEQLTGDMLTGLYHRIASLDVSGRTVKVEKRVGPLIADDHESGSSAAVILHAVVHDRRSWEALSPATQQLLAMSAQPIAGNITDWPSFQDLALDALQRKFSTDLQNLRETIQSGTLPYWQWSEDERPVQMRFSQIMKTDQQQRKLLRYAAALVTGWIWIMHDRKLGNISGLPLDNLIRLADDLNRAEDMASAVKSFPSI